MNTNGKKRIVSDEKFLAWLEKAEYKNYADKIIKVNEKHGIRADRKYEDFYLTRDDLEQCWNACKEAYGVKDE